MCDKNLFINLINVRNNSKKNDINLKKYKQ